LTATLRIAANISTLFREMPLLERFESARTRGFDGVEIQFPYTESAESLARARAAAAMPVALINGPVIPPQHPLGIAGRPEMQATFRAQLPQISEYAQALGARFVHILAGRVHSDSERNRCLRTYEDNLLFAAEMLRPLGIEVLIEPLNSADAPGYLLGSFSLARTVLERCAPAVGLQFDAYHVTRMGLDLLHELQLVLPLVRHVQFADAPGRHEPGTGQVPLEALVKALLDARYGGWLGAEYVPSGSTDDSLHWLALWRGWSRARSA
jgi:hydroxypyruvate isomerase